MDQKSIKEKISEIVESETEKQCSTKCYFDIEKEQSMSMFDPNGEVSYFKQKRYELLQKIDKHSYIGRDWVANGCIYDNWRNWIQTWAQWKLSSLNLKRMDLESLVWEDIRDFYKMFLQLLEYENILKHGPFQEINKPSPKKYNSLTRSRAFCIKLMQDASIINFYDSDNKEWLKTDLKKYIEKLWKDQSGQTVYEFFVKINARYEYFKKDYKKDFEHGKSLFENLKH